MRALPVWAWAALGWMAFSPVACIAAGRFLRGPVPRPAPAPAVADLADLADPSCERLDCGCRWFDERGDRPVLVPCATHMEEAFR